MHTLAGPPSWPSALIDVVGNVDEAQRVNRNARGELELACRGAVTSPSRVKRPAGIELLYPVVVRIRDIDEAESIGGYAPRQVELTVAGARPRADLPNEFATPAVQADAVLGLV